jgi:hypothetical protein
MYNRRLKWETGGREEETQQSIIQTFLLTDKWKKITFANSYRHNACVKSVLCIVCAVLLWHIPDPFVILTRFGTMECTYKICMYVRIYLTTRNGDVRVKMRHSKSVILTSAMAVSLGNGGHFRRSFASFSAGAHFYCGIRVFLPQS